MGSDIDVPYLKLSNGALRKLERGWYREAVIKQKTRSGKVFYIQVVTWRDKKQVMFLCTNTIGASSDFTVLRQEKGNPIAKRIENPRAQRDYVQHFNKVDHNDR